jgi:pimeloyl-ACP methyl ester carboxylesterase
MPITHINGCDLYYETHGAGQEALLFSHGLLFSTTQFHHQIDHFKRRYLILAYDHRGQGRSTKTLSTNMLSTNMLSLLTHDASNLIEAHGLAPVHFVGAGMGGVVGLSLALNHSHLVKSLTLVGTNGDAELAQMGVRILRMGIQLLGMAPLVPRLMQSLFGKNFLQNDDRLEEKLYWQERLSCQNKTVSRTANDVGRGQLGACVSGIQCPTLLLTGSEDRLMPLESVRRLQALIPQATLKMVYHAGHNPLIEEPHQCHYALEQFLRKLASVEDMKASA